MKCSNCGTINDLNSKFCLHCGSPLQNNNFNNQVADSGIVNSYNESIQLSTNQGLNLNNDLSQPNSNQTLNTSSIPNDKDFKTYLMYGINMLIKPYKTYKEKESQTSNTKFSVIFGAIIAILMMLINLIKTMISCIFTKSFDIYSLSYTSSVNFANLKNLNYFTLIGKSLLAYALLIGGIAFIYYVVCLIFKKSNNFFKNLVIASSSLIPYIFISMIISPIVEIIWLPLATIISYGGIIYSSLIFINIINDDLSFSNVDNKIYLHFICLFLIIIIIYVINRFLLTSEISIDVNNILNYLK